MLLKCSIFKLLPQLIGKLRKYNWNDVHSIVMQLYPDQEKNIEGYKQVFEELHAIKSVETKMRIVIEDVFDEYDKEYYTYASGKDGSLNKESDPGRFKDDEIGNQEVSYAIAQIGRNGSLWILIMNLCQNIRN